MLVRGRRGRQRRLRRCSSLVGERAKGKGRVQHVKVFGPGHSANFSERRKSEVRRITLIGSREMTLRAGPMGIGRPKKGCPNAGSYAPVAGTLV
jgi:hypothetical protein